MVDDAATSLTSEQIEWLRNLKMSRRAALARDFILSRGSVTTAEMAEAGYDHPPRAIRDLKDAGAGITTTTVNVNGRRMARYSFNGMANEDGGGRVVIPKAFADELKKNAGYCCGICSGIFAGRQLQVDHRVPFAIGGESGTFEEEDYMPLCAPDNRAKSWSCEHCPNWTVRDSSVCTTCFWARPTNYQHVETRPERRLNMVFQGAAVHAFDAAAEAAAEQGRTLDEQVREDAFTVHLPAGGGEQHAMSRP